MAPSGCQAVFLPTRLTPEQRQQFVQEAAALPQGGVVRQVLADAARSENDLRTCKAVEK